MATEPTASIARIRVANGNAYDEDDNPGGLAQGGHRQNFVPDLQAVADVGEWTADLAEEAAADRVQTGLDRQATAADRVATGVDRVAAAASAAAAATFNPSTYAPKDSPAFTGNPTAPTPASNDNDTTIATTAFVKAVLPAVPAKASAGEIIGGTEDTKFATAKGITDAMAFVTFTAASINLAILINGKITLAANSTFAAPTNAKEGQTGVLAITQDSTGGRTGSWNAFWDFGKAGVPTLSTGAGKIDIVTYVVMPGATKAMCSFVAAA